MSSPLESGSALGVFPRGSLPGDSVPLLDLEVSVGFSPIVQSASNTFGLSSTLAPNPS